ncbi:hypothetical protein ACFC58_43115 [Kitasatospora purpeofusca]|uniref:hypothetical protein n=1 Tax=Kitasatospora purpeofusca TaxID=67352 RepID=UPI0035DF7F99
MTAAQDRGGPAPESAVHVPTGSVVAGLCLAAVHPDDQALDRSAGRRPHDVAPHSHRRLSTWLTARADPRSARRPGPRPASRQLPTPGHCP